VDITNQQISRSRGVTAFGSDGYQQIYSQYNSSFTFASSLIPYGDSVSLPIQQAVDSCWTSGHIFRLDADSGIVLKTNFQNEELSSLLLSYPYSLSVIQSVVPMEDENPTDDECLGCWIVDGTSLIKTDANLNIEIEIISLSSPSLVCVNHATGGCFVVDEGVGIYEFNSDGDLVGVGTFTDDNIIGLLSNSEGDLYILTETELYKFVNSSGNLTQALSHGLPGYYGTIAIGCFDIDTTTDYVYVAGGDNSTLRVTKFNSSGSLLATSNSSNKFPYVIRVSQHPSSDTFYVLTDNEKIEFVESSSSSSSEGYTDSSSTSSVGYSESSSTSSEGYSESSSTSSEGYSESSSESSSSSSSTTSSSSESVGNVSSSSSSAEDPISELVDTAGSIGITLMTSLKILSDGTPAFSYVGTSALRYARASDGIGESWDLATVESGISGTGSTHDLEVVSGNPAIAYSDSQFVFPNSRIYYKRANSSTGLTGWGSSVQVATTGALLPVMKIVSGNPAVAYLDGATSKVRFTRSSDTTGSVWSGSATTIDSSVYSQNYVDLEVVSGNPAASYIDTTNSNLMYNRASNAFGSSWPAASPVTVDTSATGNATKMVVVNGNPAIVFRDSGTYRVRYIRADSADGSTWATPAVDVTSSSGTVFDIQIVNGRPTIIYKDGSTQDLMYIRADDVNGTGWTGTHETPYAGSLGNFASLQVVNGKPAITFNNGSTQIRYVRSGTTNGDDW